MNIAIWVILFFTIVNFLFTIRIAIFLVNFASNIGKRLNNMENEPPINISKTGRQLNSEDSGLIDVEGNRTYDPRFTDPEFVN